MSCWLRGCLVYNEELEMTDSNSCLNHLCCPNCKINHATDLEPRDTSHGYLLVFGDLATSSSKPSLGFQQRFLAVTIDGNICKEVASLLVYSI